MLRAQFPNREHDRQQRWLHIQNVTQRADSIVEIELDPSEAPREQVHRWKTEVESAWGNIWLHGAFFLPWADDFVRVAGVQAGRPPALLINVSETPPQYEFKLNQRFVVVNSLSDLDAAGEYYVRRLPGRRTEVLAILSASCLASQSLVLSRTAHVVHSAHHVANVVFSGLSFQHSRSAAVSFLAGASDVSFERCSFVGAGTEGLNVKGAASARVLVLDSAFADTGCGGARLEGGDVYSLSGGEHSVRRCSFTRAGQTVLTYTPALGVTGVAHEAVGCAFRDLPHMAVGKASSPSRAVRIAEVDTACVGCRVVNCSFSDVGHSTNDAGAVYFAYNILSRVAVQGCSFERVRGDASSRTWGFRPVAAIYWDLGVSYGTVIGNRFTDVDIGVIVNNGIRHTVEANHFEDAQEAVRMADPLAQRELCDTFVGAEDSDFRRQLASIDHGAAPAWQRRYPMLALHLVGVDCAHERSRPVPHSNVVAFNGFKNMSDGFLNVNGSVVRAWGSILHSNRDTDALARHGHHSALH